MGRRCVVLCALGCLHFSLQRSWVSPREHAAVGYYTAALRGAATAVHGSESSGFKRLALLHYEAVELRRARKFAESSAVYRAAIALQETLPPTKEVPTFAAAACSWLNLALTEQKTSTCLDAARSAFQEGTRYVQGLIHKELDVWIDGHHQVRSRAPVLESHNLRVARRWLATLLVAWGLLETKRGFRARAQVLAARAAVLDESKAKVLGWKVVQG
ncbi:unnamed protein product [Effrenium voratum]|uniref:Uncharacterized protein n=1 Tax=Effrenium voratum TaxID=2562239 RepID=A0AA36HQI0_9DINO|nr:unnamed protein product [Effrenium voratum]CAJ1419163.1 unnamed protein product [Effrenium voratum]